MSMILEALIGGIDDKFPENRLGRQSLQMTIHDQANRKATAATKG